MLLSHYSQNFLLYKYENAILVEDKNATVIVWHPLVMVLLGVDRSPAFSGDECCTHRCALLLAAVLSPRHFV